MKSFLIPALLIFSINFLIAQENKIDLINKKPFSIGETIEFHSNILNEKRVLNIYLPYGFSKDSTKEYPIIYLLDGSVDEDFIHIAGLVQFGNFPWLNILPESIVVGISNIDRKRDFTYPTNNKKDKKDFPTTGGSAKFIDFIEKELQRTIKTNYPITESKTIIGQSLGGLLATEILFKKPELFDNYIIVSPSLWWDDESLLRFDPQIFNNDFNNEISVYLAVGKEGKIMERTAKELAAKIKKGKKENIKLEFEYFGGQNHANILHIAVYNAFEKLFKKEGKKDH